MRVYAIEHSKATLGQFAKQIQNIYRSKEQAKESLKVFEQRIYESGYSIRESKEESFFYYSRHSSEQGQLKIIFLGTL